MVGGCGGGGAEGGSGTWGDRIGMEGGGGDQRKRRGTKGYKEISH